jgi:hypothetical protein
MRRRSGAAVASALLLLFAACPSEDGPRRADRTPAADAAPQPPANLRHVDLKVLGMT